MDTLHLSCRPATGISRQIRTPLARQPKQRTTETTTTAGGAMWCWVERDTSSRSGRRDRSGCSAIQPGNPIDEQLIQTQYNQQNVDGSGSIVSQVWRTSRRNFGTIVAEDAARRRR